MATPAISPNTTLERVVDYYTDARVLLLDQVAPYRYDDPSLITALNVTLLEARRVRPDLFVYCGDVQTYSVSDITANTIVPIEMQFRLAILHGIVAHAIERDQEDVQDARAQSFLGIMFNILCGKGIPMPPKE